MIVVWPLSKEPVKNLFFPAPICTPFRHVLSQLPGVCRSILHAASLWFVRGGWPQQSHLSPRFPVGILVTNRIWVGIWIVLVLASAGFSRIAVTQWRIRRSCPGVGAKWTGRDALQRRMLRTGSKKCQEVPRLFGLETSRWAIMSHHEPSWATKNNWKHVGGNVQLVSTCPDFSDMRLWGRVGN